MEKKYTSRFTYHSAPFAAGTHYWRRTKLWWKPMMWLGNQRWFRYARDDAWTWWVRTHITFD